MGSNKFKEFQWLKDSSGEYNYARLIGFILLILFQPVILIYIFILKVDIIGINNIFQMSVICSPSLVAVSLFLIDLFRDKNSLKVKVGAVELEYSKEEDDEDNTKSIKESNV